MVNHFHAIMISITSTMLLMLAFTVVNTGSYSHAEVSENSFSQYASSKMPELKYFDKYNELKANERTAVIYPIITQSAYDWQGIHDYYTGRCDFCTTTKLHKTYERTYSASGNGFRILEFLGYQVLDDIDVDKNPQILAKYDKVILLHNEFVTKNEFDAITSHPNVVYLYPNSMNSEVSVDYSKNSITLVRGPNYPQSGTSNGFNWHDDNSKFFNDWNCNSWEFYKVKNGFMLNCYPETFLPNNGHDILEAIKNL